MITKKITLTELRNIVKRIIKEEMSNDTDPNIDPLTHLRKAGPEDIKFMEDFFKKSREDQENDEGNVLVDFEDFKNLPEKIKRSFTYWLGWDPYGYEEIRNTWGKGDFDKAIENLTKQTFFVDYQMTGNKNTYRIKIY